MPHFPEEMATPPQSLAMRQAVGAEKQNPTSPDTDTTTDRIRVKNRRKRYLDLNPEYFKSADLELADPLLYDRLVRRFQSAEEREKEGRQRGYTGVLEADLVRSEAKIEALSRPASTGAVTYKRAPDGHILAIDQDEEATDKDSAWARWVDLMTQRFLRGEDQDFDYATVDENEQYDDRVEEERRRLEQYIDDQTPEFVGDGSPSGETGVQDF